MDRPRVTRATLGRSVGALALLLFVGCATEDGTSATGACSPARDVTCRAYRTVDKHDMDTNDRSTTPPQPDLRRGSRLKNH